MWMKYNEVLKEVAVQVEKKKLKKSTRNCSMELVCLFFILHTLGKTFYNVFGKTTCQRAYGLFWLSSVTPP